MASINQSIDLFSRSTKPFKGFLLRAEDVDAKRNGETFMEIFCFQTLNTTDQHLSDDLHFIKLSPSVELFIRPQTVYKLGDAQKFL